MEDHEIDNYIDQEMSRIFGFRQALARLIHTFGMDNFTGIETEVLAEYMYDQLVILQRYRRRLVE